MIARALRVQAGPMPAQSQPGASARSAASSCSRSQEPAASETSQERDATPEEVAILRLISEQSAMTIGHLAGFFDVYRSDMKRFVGEFKAKGWVKAKQFVTAEDTWVWLRRRGYVHARTGYTATPMLLSNFKLPSGGRASGYNAELLPEVCEVYLKAREAGALSTQQERIAAQAEIIMRGLATVGIIALVDEATGFQGIRARDALAKVLEAFIAKELQAYVRTLPPDFYSEIFRLRGLDYPTETVKKPQYFGHLTNDVVYKRLAPGVLDELQSVTPKDEKGRRKHKYFQRLTSNVGYPKLREHLGSVVTLMKLSSNWDDFARKLDQIHPRIGDTIPMALEERTPSTEQ